MDAVEFVKEKFRMCELVECCSNCPIKFGDCTISPKNIELLVPVVEKWSKEHPKKTMLQDFLEKYPNAELTKRGIPLVCLEGLGYRKNNSCSGANSENCLVCWNRTLEE